MSDCKNRRRPHFSESHTDCCSDVCNSKTPGCPSVSSEMSPVARLATAVSSLSKTEIVPSKSSFACQILELENELCTTLRAMKSQPKGITHTYNPLEYASHLHSHYVQKYCTGPKQIVFLGMNPGPYGMAQTGVPFGEVSVVRDWLGIQGQVQQPERVHPKRPILGLDCPKSEVSGTRLWGLIKKLSGGDADTFFSNAFVLNYCPLVFMAGANAKNVTPAELEASYRKQLEEICSRFLVQILDLLRPEFLVAVGQYVFKICETHRICDQLLSNFECETSVQRSENREVRKLKLGYILHPSPACPAANGGGWETVVEKQLREIGCWEILNAVNLKNNL